MRKTIAVLSLGVAMTTMAVTPVYKDPTATVEARVADLLGRMTIEEKAGQLLCPMGWEMYVKDGDMIGLSEKFRAQNSGDMPVGSYWAVLRADPWTQKTLENGLSPRQSAEALNMMQKYAVDSTRLGIPILFAEELPHGHMAIGTTVFPTGLGMASTWNCELIAEAGRTVGCEAALQGASIGYGPVLDIARDPRWSRMEETFGEDPYLTGEIGTAYMAGMQDEALVPGRRVYSTLKHFAAYGIPTAGLNGNEAATGPVRLASEFLPPFEKAVKAGAGTVMTSYNSIDGIPSTGNRELLTDVLRGKWGFEGFVYSDLFSIDGMTGSVAKDRTEAGAVALNAGVDMDLGGSAYGRRVIEALERGLITEEAVDRAVGRVLRLKFLAGLFEHPYVDSGQAEKYVGSDEHRGLAAEVARQSITLLKNEGVLPLDKNLKRIAVIGPNADTQYNQLGDYTAPQDDRDVTTVLEGIRNAVGAQTEVVYVKGCAIRDTTMTDIAAAVEAARGSNAVVLVVGGSSARDFRTSYAETGAASADAGSEVLSDMDCGEGFDRATLGLLGDQNRLMEAVLATGTPTVVVYIQGRPLDMTLASEKAQALLTAWYPGGEGGRAVADVLFGDYNPSGRLPVTVPRSVGQVPIYYAQGTRRDYMDMPGTPLYAFGYGLSYTTFDYSDLSIEKGGGNGALFTVKCRVTNAGDREGVEVVQLYVRDVVASVAQPAMSLKGFERVNLKPGDTAEIDFLLTEDDLSVTGADLQRILEPGEFRIMVGAASDDIRLHGTLTVDDHSNKQR